jgi:hypothetical protein
MKAEHRKELQTNALADRVGRFIQRARQGPSRGFVTTVLLVLVVVGAVFFFLWRRSSRIATDSRLWTEFLTGHLGELRKQDPGTIQARGADVQEAWGRLYDLGIKNLMGSPLRALQEIKKAKKLYEGLKPDVKDDPVLGPEVYYAIAVAEETLAAEDDPEQHLKRAAKLYQDVAKEYPDSAHGKKAKERARLLKDPEESRRIASFYEGLQRSSRTQMFQGLDRMSPEERQRFIQEFIKRQQK